MSENVFSFGPGFTSEMEDMPEEGSTVVLINGVDQAIFDDNRRLILSETVEQQLEAMRYFRKLLCAERALPIDAVIDSGVVPRFVQFLENDSQQELQYEAAWALTNIASGEEKHATTLVDHGVIAVFIRLVRTDDQRIVGQAAWGIGNLVGGNPEIRDLCLTAGAMPPLVEAVFLFSTNASLLRSVIWTISNLCKGKPKPSLALVSPAIPLLAPLLRATNDESITADAIWALSFISDISEEAVDMILETGIESHLVAVLRASTPLTVKTPALRAIRIIVAGNEGQTQRMINAGVIVPLGELLGAERKAIRREACWALSNIAAGNGQQVQALLDATPPVFPKVLEILRTNTMEVQKEALWVVTNVLENCSWDSVLYLVDTLHVLHPLCGLLSSGNVAIVKGTLQCIHKLLQLAADNRQRDRFILLLEEVGAVDVLENLQSHASTAVYREALSILETFFSVE